MAKILMVMVVAVAVSSWASGGGGGMMVTAEGSRVVFDLNKEPSIISKQTPSCINQTKFGDTVCEDDPEYNDRIKLMVANFLERDQGVNSLLSNPSLRNLLNDVEAPLKVDTRVGTVSERPICSAQETLIYPKRAKTSRDDWVFVLNQEGVQQALRVEKCIGDGSSCSFGMLLPGGARATCRQKYVYRRMLVLGTNKIEPEEVLMPSCCVCYTTYDELVLRSGNGSQPPAPGMPPVLQPMTPAAVPPAPFPPVAEPTAFEPVNLSMGRSVRSHGHFISFPRYRRPHH